VGVAICVWIGAVVCSIVFVEACSVSATGLLHPADMMRRIAMMKSAFFDIDLWPQFKRLTKLHSATKGKFE
jgi:hypothetical protein